MESDDVEHDANETAELSVRLQAPLRLLSFSAS